MRDVALVDKPGGKTYLAEVYAQRDLNVGSVTGIVGRAYKRATTPSEEEEAPRYVKVTIDTIEGWTPTFVEAEILPAFLANLAKDPDVVGFGVGKYTYHG